MVDHAALVDAFADYARTIARRYDIGDVLYRLTDHIVAVLEIDGAGVSIAEADGELSFVTATDEHVVRIEHLQIDLGDGPCQDAHATGDVVTSADLSAEQRWPGYTAGARDNGFRAVMGIPMAVDDSRIGALDAYARAPRDWTPEDMRTAVLLADMATGYILNAMTLEESERTTHQLQHALSSRVVVEQAKGVLVERHGIDAAAAFQKLRTHSRDRRTSIHEIARAVLEGDLAL